MANEMIKTLAEAMAQMETVDLNQLRQGYPDASDVEFGLAVGRTRDYLRQEHKIEFKPRRGAPGVLDRATPLQAYNRGRKQEHKSLRALARGKANYEVALQSTDAGERAMAESRRNRLADLSIDVATKLRQRARRLLPEI